MGWYFRSGVLVSLVLLAASRASAYPTQVDFDGTLLRWAIGPNDGPITYEVIGDEGVDVTLYESLVDQAADLWNQVPDSYFRYQRAQDGQRAQVTVNLKLALNDAPMAAGYTVFDELDKRRQPLHCTNFIALDANTSYGSLAKTVLHELGHCVGLGHSLQPKAIMSYSLEQNHFGLDVDDEAAVARIYPATDSKPRLPPGCAVGSWSGTKDHHSLCPTWLLTLLLAFPSLVPQVLWRVKKHACAGKDP